MTDESIKKLFTCDYSADGNEKKIQEALREIKPLAKYKGQTVPFEAMEKVLHVNVKKYTVDVSSVTLQRFSDGSCQWSLSLNAKGKGHKYTVCVGRTIYEVFAKSLLVLYVLVKTKKLKERPAWDEEVDELTKQLCK